MDRHSNKINEGNSSGKKQTSWGKVADWYDDVLNKERSYQKEVILPNLIRLLEIKKG